MGNGDVLEGDVELGGALEEVGADAGGDGFALGDEFGGVELGDDGFEDFVADGGQDALVVVEAEGLSWGSGWMVRLGGEWDRTGRRVGWLDCVQRKT